MTLTKDVEILRNIPLFAKLEPAKLKLLAFTSERLQYLSGDELFHQGHYGDAVYIILDGKADILVDSPKGAVKVETLGKNIVGEIATLCDVQGAHQLVALMLAAFDRPRDRAAPCASSTIARSGAVRKNGRGAARP